MSQTEKLLSNIHEYDDLLGFLNDRYPEVLKERSNGPTKAITSIHQLAEDENYDG